MSPYLGFRYFMGVFLLVFGVGFWTFELKKKKKKKKKKKILKKLCRVYFLYFVKIIHHIGFWYFVGTFFSWLFDSLNLQNNFFNQL